MSNSLRKAFSNKILELAKTNKNIYVVTSDARGSVGLEKFADETPERFVEVGIAEQNAVGVSGGIASCGKTVFTCSPAPFLSGRAYEQIKIDIVYNNRNVKLFGVSGGISYGTLGFSHHAMQDIAAMRSFPQMTVIVPSDATQMEKITELVSKSTSPVYIRVGRAVVNDIYKKDEIFQIGKSKTIHDGNDITLIAMGELVYPVLEAAKLLENKGIHARVIDMFTIKPIDQEAIIKAASETGKIMSFEEHIIHGGLGSAISEIVCDTKPVPIKIVGLPDNFCYPGESPQVFEYYGWTAEKITDKVLNWLKSL